MILIRHAFDWVAVTLVVGIGVLSHVFRSAKADGSDATLVQPSKWNDYFIWQDATAHKGALLARDTSDAVYGTNIVDSAQGVLGCAGSGNLPTWVTPGSSTITTTGTQTAVGLPSSSPLDQTLICNNATLLTIQGISAGLDGQKLTIVSKGAGQVDFVHQSGSASAANRLINFATSGNTSLAAGVGVATFVYDATTGRWRLMEHEQGAWIVPTFSAGNYSGVSSMTWTVASGDEVRRAYFLNGRTLTVANTVGVGSTVGGTPSTQLTCLVPGGFSIAGVTYTPAWINVNGTKQIGYVSANVSTPTKLLWALAVDGTNWTAGTAEIRSVISFEVQ